MRPLSPYAQALHTLDARIPRFGPNIAGDRMETNGMNRLPLACLLLCLAACDRAPKPALSIPYAKQGVQFTVTPVPGDCARATVEWKVPEAMSSRLEIQVGTKARQVFARSNEHEGKEPTGAWVQPRMAFYLVDRDSGDVLAASLADSSCIRAQQKLAGPKSAP